MPVLWEVIGGADKGGILVREGLGLNSPAARDRLSTGASLEELELVGERLHYRLVDGSGSGPGEGWVSIKVSGKELVAPKEEVESGGPGESGPVPLDEDLKRRLDSEVPKKDLKFPNYVPKYKVHGFPLPAAKLRVLCFHNAGSTETNFTTPGTPFINWIKESKVVEVMAFDYPGRGKMMKAEKHTSIHTLAEDLLSVVFDKMADGVPYIVWAHSVGTWVAFEFLMLCRKVHVPMPLLAFFMAFPAPHLPTAMRPWHKSKKLNDDMMKEELLNWDRAHFTGAGKVIFDLPAWKDTWLPLMRADFQLFDEYRFRHDGAPKFDFPIYSWHFEEEHYNQAHMVELWREWTSSTFNFEVIPGMGHLTCLYKPELKKKYFAKVTDIIKENSGF
mmetsp:Transcript_36320/g.84493  ORF Transcript_36320/g.84493 Transcript_36320/m.84493 type:complete len:388 (+) Transcript_36320:137-1300(+)